MSSGWTRLQTGKIVNMDSNRYQLITPRDLDGYGDLANDIAGVSWPEFMLHDPIADEY